MPHTRISSILAGLVLMGLGMSQAVAMRKGQKRAEPYQIYDRLISRIGNKGLTRRELMDMGLVPSSPMAEQLAHLASRHLIVYDGTAAGATLTKKGAELLQAIQRKNEKGYDPVRVKAYGLDVVQDGPAPSRKQRTPLEVILFALSNLSDLSRWKPYKFNALLSNPGRKTQKKIDTSGYFQLSESIYGNNPKVQITRDGLIFYKAVAGNEGLALPAK